MSCRTEMKTSKHTHHLRCLSLLVGLISLGTIIPQPARRVFAQMAGPKSIQTGSLNTARFNHTATLLHNGKVLIAGGRHQGFAGPILASVELYDPINGTWSETANLNTPRLYHTATLLADGKVVVVGGRLQTNSSGLESAELYDPMTGVWSSAGVLNKARHRHTATLLPNGNILVAGGFDSSEQSSLTSSELYDPASGKWSDTGSLNIARANHTATLLANGKVLIEGGSDEGAQISAELYDPNTGTWSSTSNLNKPISDHTATLLADGQVLLASAIYLQNFTSAIAAQLYDPVTAEWSTINNFNIPVAIDFATLRANLLADGRLMVTGIFDYDVGYHRTPYVYNPVNRNWSNGDDLINGPHFHTTTLLPNGRVLVVGGLNYEFVLKHAELFDSGLPPVGTLVSVSAASFGFHGLASEVITSGFGTDLTTATSTATVFPLPTQLAGTTVKVKDNAGVERLAPLFFVSPTQVNYLIPQGTAAGAASVTITGEDGKTVSGIAIIKRVAPSLFAANAGGQGVAAGLALRVKSDGSQSYEPIAKFDAAQSKFVSLPLDLGPPGDRVYLVLFGTGIRDRSSLSFVIASIGGTNAEVSYAGAQGDFVGLDQVNVLVPRSLSGRGEVEVLLTVEAQLANPVRINLK